MNIRRPTLLIIGIIIGFFIVVKPVNYQVHNNALAFASAKSHLISTEIAQANIEDDAENENSLQDWGDVVLLGLTIDASPVSNFAAGGVAGFCREVEDYLDTVKGYDVITVRFKNREPRFTGIDTSLRASIDSDADAEEYLNNDGNLAQALGARIVECGPSSITQDRIDALEKLNGGFSEPFLVTGTKILIKNRNQDLFYDERPFAGKRIGILGSTTTDDLIFKIFPFALPSDEPINTRSEAARELRQGDIVAYASDAIILEEMLKDRSTFELQDYTILPKTDYLSYEQYGLVVYNDASLLEDIDR